MGQSRAPGTTVWRKSSRCDSHQCVEIALRESEAAVRDSVSPEQHLTFTATDWQRFIAGVRAGAFATPR